MKTLLLLLTPFVLFSQQNNLNIETIKDEYIQEIYGIIYYMEKPYNGVFYANYENGKLHWKDTYKDGKRNGLSEEYYENGKLKEKATYKEGKRDGIWEEYYENGQLEAKLLKLKHDKPNFTTAIEKYYENGQLKQKMLFENGEIVLDYRFLIEDTNIEDVNVYDLEAMVRLFLKDCKSHNIKLSSDYKITSTFEPLGKGVVALSSGIFNDSEVIIKVSPEEWSKASNPKRWYILYHELGHDVLNLQHGQGGKMMFNFTEKDYNWDEFFTDKEYMLNSISK